MLHSLDTCIIYPQDWEGQTSSYQGNLSTGKPHH